MSTHIGAAAGRHRARSSCCPATRCARGGSPRPSSTTPAATPRCAGCSASPAPGSGHPVSVQGSGMGQPSLAIYVTELFTEYDVQSVVRVGSCGALTERLALRDVVIALRRLHRLLDEPDHLRGPRLRPGRRLRAAPRAPSRRPSTAAPTCTSGCSSPATRSTPSRPELVARMVGLRRARRRDGGERALHAGRQARPARRWRSARSPTTSSPARRRPPPSGSRRSARWSRSP